MRIAGGARRAGLVDGSTAGGEGDDGGADDGNTEQADGEGDGHAGSFVFGAVDGLGGPFRRSM